MKGNTSTKTVGRINRHKRIRSRVAGTSARPRFSIYKSNRYIHAQLIDDEAGKTLIALSTKGLGKGTKTEVSKQLGVEMAKRAKDMKLNSVVFDRGGFRYTGRIAAVAEAARQGGLIF